MYKKCSNHWSFYKSTYNREDKLGIMVKIKKKDENGEGERLGAKVHTRGPEFKSQARNGSTHP